LHAIAGVAGKSNHYRFQFSFASHLINLIDNQK
jgi:hypothetical protein